jgi:hypothetical protein
VAAPTSIELDVEMGTTVGFPRSRRYPDVPVAIWKAPSASVGTVLYDNHLLIPVRWRHKRSRKIFRPQRSIATFPATAQAISDGPRSICGAYSICIGSAGLLRASAFPRMHLRVGKSRKNHVANITFGKFESRQSKTTTPRMFLPASMCV